MNDKVKQIKIQLQKKIVELSGAKDPNSTNAIRISVLKDLVDCIDQIKDIAGEPTVSSWEGHVDRQSGAFDDSEIIERFSWR